MGEKIKKWEREKRTCITQNRKVDISGDMYSNLWMSVDLVMTLLETRLEAQSSKEMNICGKHEKNPTGECGQKE